MCYHAAARHIVTYHAYTNHLLPDNSTAKICGEANSFMNHLTENSIYSLPFDLHFPHTLVKSPHFDPVTTIRAY
jgi:hypothetical protein